MKRIIVNGKEYNNMSDLPGMLQTILKDENKDGVPDIAEQAIKNAKSSDSNVAKYC